jgi:hypothetical protein
MVPGTLIFALLKCSQMNGLHRSWQPGTITYSKGH